MYDDLRACAGRNVETIERYYDKLERELERYISDLPVYSFNGGRYDLPLLRHQLIPCLNECGDYVRFVAKKGNNYKCMATSRLKFLDICNYIAPGFSYSDYLRAYKAPSQKPIWIHDRFDLSTF